MGKVTPLRPAALSAPRSVEREALAEAIVRHAAAVEAEARVVAAKANAGALWFAADGRIESAKARLAEARAAEPRRMVERMLSGHGPCEGQELHEAEEALTKAENDLRFATEADRLLDEQLRSVKSDVAMAARVVGTAIGAVLTADPVSMAAVEEMNAARARFEDAFAIVDLLESKNCVARRQNVEGQILSWLRSPILADHRAPGRAVWNAAIEALYTDPDAPLPSIKGAPDNPREAS